MVELNINGERQDVAMESDTPLLWALRDGLQLTGTKFSCGIAVCGACVVLVDGKPVVKNTQSLSVQLGRLDRGAHQLQAQIRNKEGGIIVRNRPTVVFIHNTSVH